MNWLDTILNEAVPAYLNRNVSFVLFFAVIMLARLTLTKFPKKYSYMLWGFLGIKAVFDFGFSLKLGEFTHKAGAAVVENGEKAYHYDNGIVKYVDAGGSHWTSGSGDASAIANTFTCIIYYDSEKAALRVINGYIPPAETEVIRYDTAEPILYD